MNNNYVAEWDQRAAYQMRLDNYIRNIYSALVINEYAVAYRQARAYHSEIIGWITKSKDKEKEDDIQSLDLLEKKAKAAIAYLSKMSQGDDIAYLKITEYVDRLNFLSHKYNLVIQQKDRMGGYMDV